MWSLCIMLKGLPRPPVTDVAVVAPQHPASSDVGHNRVQNDALSPHAHLRHLPKGEEKPTFDMDPNASASSVSGSLTPAAAPKTACRSTSTAADPAVHRSPS